MGDVESARYEPALLPPCLTIRVLSYSNRLALQELSPPSVVFHVLTANGEIREELFLHFHRVFILL